MTPVSAEKRATVEEMTCQPTDFHNDFWLAQREMLCSSCLLNEKTQDPASTLTSPDLQKLRGGGNKTDHRFPVAFD